MRDQLLRRLRKTHVWKIRRKPFHQKVRKHQGKNQRRIKRKVKSRDRHRRHLPPAPHHHRTSANLDLNRSRALTTKELAQPNTQELQEAISRGTNREVTSQRNRTIVAPFRILVSAKEPRTRVILTSWHM